MTMIKFTRYVYSKWCKNPIRIEPDFIPLFSIQDFVNLYEFINPRTDVDGDKTVTYVFPSSMEEALHYKASSKRYLYRYRKPCRIGEDGKAIPNRHQRKHGWKGGDL